MGKEKANDIGALQHSISQLDQEIGMRQKELEMKTNELRVKQKHIRDLKRRLNKMGIDAGNGHHENVPDNGNGNGLSREATGISSEKNGHNGDNTTASHSGSNGGSNGNGSH